MISTAERNIRMLIAYDGTAYAGWQRQKEQPTVQGALEDKIALMTREPVTLYGAGRTDAGVHALGMCANFKTRRGIPCLGFQKGLNSLLAPDIRVLALDETAERFHARFDALGKTYFYQVITSPLILPTQRLYYAHFPRAFDLAAMDLALSSLLGEHDFTSFEAAGSRDLTITHGRGAVRTINHKRIYAIPGGFTVEIGGDGFLRHMVRNIIGTLIPVGRGEKTVANFKKILYAKERSAAGSTAPAQGLFLKEVFY
ncbi:MAG TPA: tRNA pseudouridine(38-40) synthase TruA [Desulfobacterales bacterium]|nr:tRNA pseudouridine(38-40) synthase TruA [Desulfobacterales bacterium]